MKEQLISFETAKLAKEKGFKEECFYSYSAIGNLHEPYSENGSSTDTQFRVNLTDLLENFNRTNEISAPTQSFLQKWLREVHEIQVNIDSFGHKGKTMWDYEIKRCDYDHIDMSWGIIIQYNDSRYFISYETALEQGLQEALKLI